MVTVCNNSMRRLPHPPAYHRAHPCMRSTHACVSYLLEFSHLQVSTYGSTFVVRGAEWCRGVFVVHLPRIVSAVPRDAMEIYHLSTHMLHIYTGKHINWVR